MEFAARIMNPAKTAEYMLLHPDLHTFRGEYLIIERSKNWAFIDETDKYAFKERMKCSRGGLSPAEYAAKHHVNISVARRAVDECTLFPVPAALAVLNIFAPKKWLDPTAGWGDRLRAALIYGIEKYRGIDSNPDLASVYKAIIDSFEALRFKTGKSDNSKTAVNDIDVITSRFQDAIIDDKYDLIFTSPPFGSFELYREATNWSNEEHFMTEFFDPLMKFSSDHMTQNGHIVIYIEQIDDVAMLNRVGLLRPELIYEGCFYYEGVKPRPYHVWKRKRF